MDIGETGFFVIFDECILLELDLSHQGFEIFLYVFRTPEGEEALVVVGGDTAAAWTSEALDIATGKIAQFFVISET